MSLKESNNFLPHEVTGDINSNNVIFFLHGWPDTLRLWDNIIS